MLVSARLLVSAVRACWTRFSHFFSFPKVERIAKAGALTFLSYFASA